MYRSGLAGIQGGLTKHEASMILDGYPPFYKSHLPTRFNFCLENIFPENERRFMMRAGWVVAVGFTNFDVFTPVPVYVNIKEEVYKRRALFVHSVVRAKDILDVLHDKFSPSDSPDERTCIQATIDEVKFMLQKSSESLAGGFIAKTRVPASRSVRLNLDQCVMAISFFNDINTLDLTEFKKILRPVLCAVYTGVKEIYKYCKNVGRELPELEDWIPRDDTIYLRACLAQRKA